MQPRKSTQQLSKEIIDAKQHRLEILKIQAATYGIDVPPHVVTEIDTLEDELAVVTIVGGKAIDPQIKELLYRSDQIELLSKFMGDHARRLMLQENKLNEFIEEVKRWFALRISQQLRLYIFLGMLFAGITITLLLVIALVVRN